ncbi:hypothetical protein TH606_06175 [Thermodesulfatator autotrophicus]|uniref:Uncharacterized protein n=1 Tax=Thermodesulfatator autotrophicus TaxID=1795632 RepID=A0A177E7S9_9BACT|nr:hypothetical protein TH606_06175 [Thermodesulfatator autotrophicus]
MRRPFLRIRPMTPGASSEVPRENKFCGIFYKRQKGRALSKKPEKAQQNIFAAQEQSINGVWIFSLHLSRARARYVGLFANEIHLFLTCFTYNLLNLSWHFKKKWAF